MLALRTSELVALPAIQEARRRLEGVAVVTPLDRSRALSERVGGPVFIKCENLQRTGSFKIRGAYNLISRLNEGEKKAGVVTASAGNHAQGVALAASLVGAPATVFMPSSGSIVKAEATRRYGASVELVGKDFGAAADAATRHADATGSVFVSAFDHPDIIAGQGTLGCEVSEQLDDIGTVVVPVGGGGLISGVAAALRGLRDSLRIVGVQASGAASFPPSLSCGEPVTLEHMATIADGIAANRPGDLTFEHVRSFVDDIVCVSDEAMAEGLVFAAERMKLVLEPAGAAGIAAVLNGLGDLEPPVVVVLSGGNIDPLLLLRVVRFGLSASGRYFAFRTRMSDRPGELLVMLELIAELGANIVGIAHHREGLAVDLGEVDVTLQVETKGKGHIEEVAGRLAAAGYIVEPL
ncbi:MAG: threonine ammonia-lyase [Actinobacteria bacterium]|nr:threonine ammonia-lyase [Actinomycetota bacterium]